LAQFEFERDYPQRQVQFMQSLLQGLPLETQAYNYSSTSPLQTVAGGATVISDLYDILFPSITNSAGANSQTAQQRANAQALINSLDPNFVGPDPRVG
jgi:hypothetical protein